jgi:hypothetical protein
MLNFSEPGGERDDRRSEASASMGKWVEHSLRHLPIEADSSLRLGMT